MKEWEKELQIYRLMPAPPKENNLQKYILRYLSKKDDKYISESTYPVQACDFILENMDLNTVRFFNEYNW